MPAEAFVRAVVPLLSTPTVVYTAPANGIAIIRRKRVNNVSGIQQVFQEWQGTADNAHVTTNPTTLNAGDYGIDDDSTVLAPGESIRAQASSDNGITMTVHGVEIT